MNQVIEITTAHGMGRPLSEAQRSHLATLIAAMNVAEVRLDAARRVADAETAAAQKEFAIVQAQAQAFLNYCGAELGCTFSDGGWQFDQQIMAFVRAPEDAPNGPPRQAKEVIAEAAEVHLNGQVQT